MRRLTDAEKERFRNQNRKGPKKPFKRERSKESREDLSWKKWAEKTLAKINLERANKEDERSS